jgi:hypothetical protein
MNRFFVRQRIQLRLDFYLRQRGSHGSAFAGRIRSVIGNAASGWQLAAGHWPQALWDSGPKADRANLQSALRLAASRQLLVASEITTSWADLPAPPGAVRELPSRSPMGHQTAATDRSFSNLRGSFLEPFPGAKFISPWCLSYLTLATFLSQRNGLVSANSALAFLNKERQGLDHRY